MTQTATGTLKSLNPATLEVIGEVNVAGEAQVRDAFTEAREAQQLWASFSLDDRSRVLRRAAAIVASRSDELARMVVAEGGKTFFEAYAAEVVALSEAFRWLSRNLGRNLREQRLGHGSLLFAGKKSTLSYEPLGVVGIISPWNYPLSIPGTETAFCVAAGNGVVIKPSEFTPLIAEVIPEILEQAGVPHGLVQVVHGEGSTGAAMVEARPDKLLFTGSVLTGRIVGAAAMQAGIPVTLELGGKDASYVRHDANLDRAVGGALFGSYFNCGQTCAAIERVYVHGDIADRFIEQLAQRASNLKVGNPSDVQTDVGPMIHEQQLSVVERHVADAESRGAQRLSGGRIDPGLPGAFYAPAVVTNVSDDSSLMREETFGPVVGVRVVDSDEEAVVLANDSEFGLTASVFTSDAGAAMKIAHQLEAGTVFVNDSLYSYVSAASPWGGTKSSGTGVTHSRFGLHDVSQLKHISVDRGLLPLGYPFTAEKVAFWRDAVTALNSRGIGRLTAAARATRGAIKIRRSGW